ncbi:hypothetical protein ABBQ32_004173 [Trebouxia sp. C0010 RCD-2024]
MQPARDASVAYSRIAVLSAHFAAAKSRESPITCSDCSAPAYARAAVVQTAFARPVSTVKESDSNHGRDKVLQPRLVGPEYQPTKPGTYNSYARRASARPHFARPTRKVDQSSRASAASSCARRHPQVVLVFPLKAFYVAVWLSLLHMCCIGDIRLELQGTELVITGKQGMTGSKMESVSLSPAGTFRAHCKLPNEVDTRTIRAELLNGLLCIKARKQFRG